MNLNKKCSVKNKEVEIKGFFQASTIVESSPLIGGHQGGVITYVVALVEYEDGTFEKVGLNEIQGFVNKGVIKK